MPDIELWLKSIGLEKYGEVFARHDVDLDVAPNLSEQDLEKLGLSLGHRRKFGDAPQIWQRGCSRSPNLVACLSGRQRSRASYFTSDKRAYTLIA